MSSREISMESRLSLILVTVEKIRSDPELRPRLEERKFNFYVAVSEALANAVTHGNRNKLSRKVHVLYNCEPDDELSILIRDEGGFDPENVPIPKSLGEDRISEFGS
jgi:anti-sigma regulatory factor (Ser/Thr protein kinase)